MSRFFGFDREEKAFPPANDTSFQTQHAHQHQEQQKQRPYASHGVTVDERNRINQIYNAETYNLVPADNKLLIFRSLTGIDHVPILSKDGFFSPRQAPNMGIYTRVVQNEKDAASRYRLFNILTSACLAIQIIFSAALTAIGAAHGPSKAVTAFGAINTIVAGIMTYLRGSGLPGKKKQVEKAWGQIREYIEQREREFCLENCTLEVGEEIHIIEQMYEQVKHQVEVGSSDSGGSKGFDNILSVRSRSALFTNAREAAQGSLQHARGAIFGQHIEGGDHQLGNDLRDLGNNFLRQGSHGRYTGDQIKNSSEQVKNDVGSQIRDADDYVKNGASKIQHAGQDLREIGGRIQQVGENLRNTDVHLSMRTSSVSKQTQTEGAGTNLLYSTAEVFTWKKFSDYTVLVLYGGDGEHHELAITSSSRASVWVVEGSKSEISTQTKDDQVIIGWDVSSSRKIVKVDDVLVFLIDRSAAYNYWVPQVGTSSSSVGYTSQQTVSDSIIVNGGYLIRFAYMQGDELHLSADFNATATLEIIGAPSYARDLFVNGVKYDHSRDRNGFWCATVRYSTPRISLPDLSTLQWKYIDTLPEIQASYDDSPWVSANHDYTNNSISPLQTPMSLYSGDYGFTTGYLLYRGHFVANGDEKFFYVEHSGGSGFGSSVWINDVFLGSWLGSAGDEDYSSNYTLPTLESGSKYNITMLIDTTGLDEDWTVGTDDMKNPRGILDFELSAHDQSDVSWKLTGNLGGEDYIDLTRGPRNEGGLYAERQGWHQPSPPSWDWKSSSPKDGINEAGVGFYSTSFNLDLPEGYDIPLYFSFGGASSPCRVQLYVNGYQFGKYVPQLGPQTLFPVPQGILNYQDENWVAVTLWAQDSSGASLENFELIYETPVLTALTGIESSPQPAWTERAGAY